MENKNEGNGNKKILGDFNCSINKMDRCGGNKTHRLYVIITSCTRFRVNTHFYS